MTRITVLQPEPYVPLDRFAGWLDDVEVVVVDLERDAVPAVDALGDALLVLGGRMDANDDARSPWLPAVRQLLRGAVDARVPTLGICLGHQILATAFGGEVTVGAKAQDEEGAVELRWEADADDDPLVGPIARDPRPSIVAQSHHDAVTRLPEGATLLASSDACPVQAFRVGSAVGVQFHPEASPELMARWADGHGGDGEAIRREMTAVDDDVARVGEALARALVRLARPRPGLPAVGV